MIIPVSWAVGQAIVGPPETLWARLAIAAIGAGATTAWDLYLDPQMVKWGFWEWDQDGAYLGIPIRNFIGWFFTALVMGLILFPPAIPVAPLLLLFSLIWIMQFVAQMLFWKLRVSAVVGLVAMGLFVVPAVLLLLISVQG
jgi:putative membrane protein